jgi:hypothetical protein
MHHASRPVALVLLVMAVLCGPAGVCVIDGIARTVEAAPTAPAHACGKSMGGTFFAASEEACCSEQPTGFVTLFRFTLQKQAAAPALEFDLAPAVPVRPVSFRAGARRTPLVLRI